MGFFQTLQNLFQGEPSASPIIHTPETTACFTGHRPHKLPFGYREDNSECIALKRTLSDLIEELITEKGVTRFISGLALGFDIWAAECVMEAQRRHRNVVLQVAIPSKDQTERWTGANRPYQDRYDAILRSVGNANIIYTSEERMGGKERGEMAAMYDARNHYMVDSSAHVIACWTGDASGTGKTVYYAVKQGRAQVFLLNPYQPTQFFAVAPGNQSQLTTAIAALRQRG